MSLPFQVYLLNVKVLYSNIEHYIKLINIIFIMLKGLYHETFLTVLTWGETPDGVHYLNGEEEVVS